MFWTVAHSEANNFLECSAPKPSIHLIINSIITPPQAQFQKTVVSAHFFAVQATKFENVTSVVRRKENFLDFGRFFCCWTFLTKKRFRIEEFTCSLSTDVTTLVDSSTSWQEGPWWVCSDTESTGSLAGLVLGTRMTCQWVLDLSGTSTFPSKSSGFHSLNKQVLLCFGSGRWRNSRKLGL